MPELHDFIDPTKPLALMSTIVVGLMSLATLAVFALGRMKPDKDMTELRLRTRSWWIMAGVFLITVCATDRLTYVLFALMSYMALKEYFTMLPTKAVDRAALFWSYACIPFQYYWAATEWYGMFIIFVPVLLFLFLPFMQILTGETRRFVSRTSVIHWGVMLFVFGLSHLAYLTTIPLRPSAFPHADGRSLLVFLVFITEANDIFQFLCGKTFGRHKISPSVSPNKTWEGFLGGVVLSTGAGALLAFCTPFGIAMSAACGAILACSGFIGDLVVSAIKRDHGVKDSSSAIPGHGGVLDRVDSLCYTAPVFFHLVNYGYAI